MQKIKKYKKTAVSFANIAFIKFWGKKDRKLNIPYNNSISMNLSNCKTTTTVEFNPRFREDSVFLDGERLEGEKKLRVLKVIDLVREKAAMSWRVKVFSKNNFPKDAGIASSASGFSALALSASSASGLSLSQKELSILARRGSGSACRSIPGGFVEWIRGRDDSSSFAVQIAKANFWDLRDIVAVIETGKKEKSSTEGHLLAESSPFFKIRQKLLPNRLEEIKEAFLKKNFKKFGEILEEEAVEFNVIAMTSKPPIFYWKKETFEIIEKVRKLREKGILSYFTTDAGPNVHVFCLAKDAFKINKILKRVPGVLFTIINKPAQGAYLISKHLF